MNAVKCNNFTQCVIWPKNDGDGVCEYIHATVIYIVLTQG